MKRVLAIDLGASSGRAMLACSDNARISMEEIHRFENVPITQGGALRWNFPQLLSEVKTAIKIAVERGGFDSLGIDTWGVDFGLIGEDGQLLENPVHYRDERTHGMLEKAFEVCNRDDMYQRTGIQFMEINTAFQLLSLKLSRPEVLAKAKSMLLMPDLFGYALTGCRASEYTIATTTQLVNACERDWDYSIIDALGIKRSLFEEIRPSGTVLGNISAEICAETGCESVPVVMVAGHDTQSAVAAVPVVSKDFAYLSCGTWSLLGTELDAACISERSQALNLSNEGGVENRYCLLKNIIGLWVLQECRRNWKEQGQVYSYTELEQLATQAQPFGSLIDPDAPDFASPCDMPQAIRQYCERTGQKVPQTVGEITRCVYESLALKYRLAIGELEECCAKSFAALHIVGGGSQSEMLCDMTACACGIPVLSGPIEATVLGNIALQLVAIGEMKDVAHARRIIAQSENVHIYESCDTPVWEEQLPRMQALIG